MNSRKMITTLALVLAVVLCSVSGFGATWTDISLGSAGTSTGVITVGVNKFGGGLTWGSSSWDLVGIDTASYPNDRLTVSGKDVSPDGSLYLAHEYYAQGQYSAEGPVALILGEFATGFKFTTGNIQTSGVPLTVTFYNTGIEAPVYTWGLTLDQSAGAYQKFSTEEFNIGLFNAVLFTQSQ